MPISIAFAEPATIPLRVSGEVTSDEIVEAINRVAGMEQLRPGAQILADVREMTGVPGTNVIRDAAYDMGRLREKGLGAMAIAADRPFVYGISRMFATFAGMVSLNVGTFRCMDEARVWLAEQRTATAA